MVHRISGLALACFLPLHFLTLGLAIDGEARLDGFLRWTRRPLVKLAETVLVFLLAVHMLGGIRVLVIENLAWREGQKRLARGGALHRRRSQVSPSWPAWSKRGRMLERLKTDILILGSGGAGLFAALHAHQADPALDVTVATKGLLGKCGCTRMVQGGYNVALNPGDSIERHFMDTIEGGKWLPNQELAWTLVTKAIERVHELENEIGCFFDRNADGTLHGKAFAGQTFDRTVHKGDLTGIEIINRLMEQVWARPIRRLEEHRAVALIPAQGRQVAGGRADDRHAHRPLPLRRGAGRAARHRRRARPCTATTRPPATRAWTASPWRCAWACRCATWRWCSSIPTGLLAGPDTRMTGTVLEEGLRGSGGHLLNGAQRALHGRATTRAPSAPRATSSRAASTRRCAPGAPRRNGGVYIKMSHLGPEKVRKQFKGMVERCADCGFDLAGGLVEVVPTAHYFMGGVVCGVDTSTELPGLFVAGEDAGGVHGANRLGGNGVANSTVFGGIAGETMAAWIAAQSAASARPTRT